MAQQCPALLKNKMCNKCQKPGHLSFACLNKSRPRRHSDSEEKAKIWPKSWVPLSTSFIICCHSWGLQLLGAWPCVGQEPNWNNHPQWCCGCQSCCSCCQCWRRGRWRSRLDVIQSFEHNLHWTFNGHYIAQSYIKLLHCHLVYYIGPLQTNAHSSLQFTEDLG